MPKVSLPGTTLPEPGHAVRVDAAGTPVAVFNIEGKLFALEARCPHRGGPMDRGPVTGHSVTCPWHGSQFSLDTGAVERGPAVTPLRIFGARVEDGVLVIESP